MTDKDHPYIGSGWAFPPRFGVGGQTVEMASGLEDIRQSLEVLIATRLGERVMHPNYGCNMDALVFEPAGYNFLTYLRHLVETAVKYYEARIQITEINIDDSFALDGRFDIEVRFILRNGRSVHNFIYPYYLENGGK